ncbi:MAG TPA: damage-inducible protein [Acetobacteraceae bacterium]|jgi:protein ImuA|nr:damage-inducible protein [Acetobacteraceae bacterium]
MVEQNHTTAVGLAALKVSIARIGRSAKLVGGTLPLGMVAVDAHLPGSGLALGALHEIAGGGPDIEHGTAAALLIAGVLARRPGPVLWLLERPDLFSPALDAVGLQADRVIYAEAGKPATVLQGMEEGLRHPGLAGVVGELSGRLTLTASRRLQLAAEQSGTICFVLRRSRRHDDPSLLEPTAAATRWRVAALPSPPVLAHAPQTPGLARPRWRLDLLRCRGGEPASWIVEATDATGHLGLPAGLADRPIAAPPDRSRAAAG